MSNTKRNYEIFRRSKPVLFFITILRWPRQKIRGVYEWVVGWAETKRSDQALAGIAFAESSFFPIPPDPLLIATVIVKPKRWVRLAIITTVASILGGVLGYIIGIGLFESLGVWVIDTYHLHSGYQTIGESYKANAFLTIFSAAFTPIPYKLITIAAGAFHVNFFIFIVASIFGRGMRFFIVSWFMQQFGKRYQDKIAKYVDILGLLLVALIVLGFIAVRYLL